MKLLRHLNSAPFLRIFHGIATLLWIALVPAALLTGLKMSLPFVVFISLYANIVGRWSSWQAARVEVKQDEVTVNAETANVDPRANKPT